MTTSLGLGNYLLETLKFLFLMFIQFLGERETESARKQGRSRERETQNLKQAPGSEPLAQIPKRGSNSQALNCDLSRSLALNRLSHPRTRLLETFHNRTNSFPWII